MSKRAILGRGRRENERRKEIAARMSEKVMRNHTINSLKMCFIYIYIYKFHINIHIYFK